MPTVPPPPTRPPDDPDWVELMVAAAVVQCPAIDRLDFPALVVTVPGRVMTAVNDAAAGIFGLRPESMLGRVVDEVVTLDDETASVRSTAAIADGTIVGYRALRHFTGGDGVTREYAMWMRGIEIDGTHQAIGVLARSGDGPGSVASLPVFPLEPLVVGTVDVAWRIRRISNDVHQLCGCEPAELVGDSLDACVHPDDVAPLHRAAEVARTTGSITGCRLRLRFDQGQPWGRVRFLVCPGHYEDSPDLSFGFALLPDDAEPTAAAPGDRVAELEERLRRIAAELRGAGMIDDAHLLPTAAEHPQVNQLSSRQWEILVRLLRGDRVPAIAAELFLSPHTVRNHLSTIFSIFGVHSQAELISLLRPRR